MKSTQILWVVLLATAFFTTGCGENCDFDEEPIIEAVDCGFQAPFRQYTQWTYLDSLTGDTVVLEKDTTVTEVLAETPPCERWENDSVLFKQNPVNVYSIVFRKSDLQIQEGESPFARATQNIQFLSCTPSEPEMSARDVLFEVLFFESLTFHLMTHKDVYLARQTITSFNEEVTLNAWLNKDSGLIKLSRLEDQKPLMNISLLKKQ
ncbi:MAG: hypothetical protein ACOCZ8_00770 [Bacteroidota bacterium]